MQQLMETAKEFGLSLGVFGLCVWMVRQVISSMSGSINNLCNRMNIFTTRVQEEHKSHKDELKGSTKVLLEIKDVLVGNQSLLKDIKNINGKN